MTVSAIGGFSRGVLGYRGIIYNPNTSLYNLTGEQLFDGWCKAVQKIGIATKTGRKNWRALDPSVQSVWCIAATALNARVTALRTAEEFIALFFGQLNPAWITPDVMAAAKELVDNWAGYFDFSGNISCNAKGDVWLFKASGLKAKVIDVAGTKLKLRLANGTETDWIEESEVAKSATKSA